MSDNVSRFRVGVFVLCTLALLAGMTLMFGRLPGYFRDMNSFTVLFPKAGGVTAGAPVRRSGVRIGEVHDVQLDDLTSKVRVVVLIDPKYKIRKNDRPTIVQGLFGGDAAIEMSADASIQDIAPIPAGAVIDGYVRADPLALLDQTSSLLHPAQDAVGEIRDAFKRLEKLGPLVQDFVKESREIAVAARASIPEITRTAEEIRDFARSARGSMPDLAGVSSDVQAAARAWTRVAERAEEVLDEETPILKTVQRLDDVLKRVEQVLTDENQKNASRILANLAKSSDRFDSLAQNAEALLKEGRTTFANANKVFSDENQQKINDTLENFKKGSDRFPALMGAAEHLVYEARVATRKVDGIITRSDQFFSSLESLSKPFAERGGILLQQLEAMTCNMNRLAVDGRELMLALSRSDGTLQRLASDPSLYLSVNASAAMVNQMLPRLDRVLRDLEIFSDKIARHPEALGLGGVVRPGSGLKGPPTALPYRGP